MPSLIHATPIHEISPQGRTPDGKFLSALAGIVDPKGLNRIVVTELSRMHHHVCKERNERVIVVPNVWVKEPIPYEDYYEVVETGRAYVLRELSGPNPCGECRACCVAPPIKFAEYIKKAHEPCTHLCGHGCKRYTTRPEQCRQFECSWLKSQSRNDVMPPELRPDRCGVFFMDRDTLGGDPLVFEIHPDPARPDAVNSPAVEGYLNEMRRGGYKAKLITYYTDPI